MKQEEMAPAELARLMVPYSIPGMEMVTVRRDVPYRVVESGPLTFDVYYPPGSTSGRLPAVLFVHGYSDAGMPDVFGRVFKEMGQVVSWARLFAASGMVVVVYSNRDPVDDLQALLHHLHDHAAGLGIDVRRLGLWAASGHVPLALWLLMQAERREVVCAALGYGFMLDLHGATSVADMQKTYRFANPGAGRSLDDVRDEVPILVVRAGRDQFPGVNESIDRFISGALQRDLPLRLINHAGAPHAFDLFDDGRATREVIREILRFMQFHLSRPAEADSRPAEADSRPAEADSRPAEAGHYAGSDE